MARVSKGDAGVTTLTYIGRRRVDPMSPARAVEMQKAGMDTRQIAAHFGISALMLTQWFKYLGYDPIAYHADALCAAVGAGQSLTAAMAAVGLPYATRYGDRARDLLNERAVSRRWVQRAKDTKPTCETCGIVLEPYDPANIEQQSWQNGTRDGLHCTKCENGGSWLGRLPLPAHEAEPVSLGEAFRYAG